MTIDDFLLPCPLHWLTGLDCPLCGMQRAVLALLRGDFAEAWALNPVGWLVLPYFVAYAVAEFFVPFGQSTVGRALRGDRALVIVFVILVLWGVVRNLL